MRSQLSNRVTNIEKVKEIIRTVAAIEKIAVEVPSEIAEAYRSATETQRSQIATRIGLMLRSDLPPLADKMRSAASNKQWTRSATKLLPMD